MVFDGGFDNMLDESIEACIPNFRNIRILGVDAILTKGALCTCCGGRLKSVRTMYFNTSRSFVKLDVWSSQTFVSALSIISLS